MKEYLFPRRRGWRKTSKKIEQQTLRKPKVKLKMRVSNAGTQTVYSDFKVKTQTRAATQTDEIEYLFKETVVQPSAEEGAVLHWFAWF